MGVSSKGLAIRSLALGASPLIRTKIGFRRFLFVDIASHSSLWKVKTFLKPFQLARSIVARTELHFIGIE